MDIDEIIEHSIKNALAGKAVLFLGAGFSCTAQNMDMENIYTGGDLLKKLREYLKLEDDNSSLPAIAEYYIRQNGAEALIKLLRKKFLVNENGVGKEHRIISNLPWINIYTTNYDNIVEVASVGKVIPIVLSDEITLNGKKCIHLNGYIGNINENTIDSEIKLTSSSYDENITESLWFKRFASEVKAAKSIIFVGYSMPDLDISRLLVANDELRAKCVFIDSDKLSRISEARIEKFGYVVKIGVREFAQRIENIAKTFIVDEKAEEKLYAFEEYKYELSDKSVEDNNFFDLFLKGIYDNRLIENQPYLLERSGFQKIIDDLEKKYIPIIFSSLANGKTMLLNTVCNKLSTNYKIFILRNNSDTTIEELKSISQRGNVVLVIENYNHHFDELRLLAPYISSNLRIILTARTNAHDYFYERLRSIFHEHKFIFKEHNCDKLDENSIDWLSNTFDHYGVWGEYTTKSADWKRNFLAGQTVNSGCNQQFHSILLFLLKSPEIRKRVYCDFEQIQKNINTRNILNVVSILEIIFGEVSTQDLEIVFAANILNSDMVRGNTPLRNFIDFQHSKVMLKSAALALFFIENEDLLVTFNNLIKIHNAYSNSYQDTQQYRKKAIQLVRFANVSQILAQDADGVFIKKYFSNIKVHPLRKKDPLFWLQYATACTEVKEYEMAEKFFASSRGCAQEKISFDSFQIDNREAIFLLKRSIHFHDYSNSKKMLNQAIRLIRNGLINHKERERIRKPFRPAIFLHEFYLEYYNELEKDIKTSQEIQKAVKNILRCLAQLPDSITSHPELIDCKKKMLFLEEKLNSYC